MPECPRCHDPVIKAHYLGRTLLLDPSPSAAGTWAVRVNGAGGQTVREAPPGETITAGEQRLIEHRFLCTAAETPQSVTEPRVEAPAGLAAIQAETMRQRADKRRSRWRRKPPEITGIRRAAR